MSVLLAGLLLFLVLWSVFACFPMALLGFAWYRWHRALASVKEPKWRSAALFLGLVAGSLNFLLSLYWFYSWHNPRGVLEALPFNLLMGKIGVCTCLFVICTAIIGRGGGRGILAGAAVSGLLGWGCAHMLSIID